MFVENTRYSETEQRFLRQEHATAGLREMTDLRKLGCPERIYDRIIEQRAKKLGPQLAAFVSKPCEAEVRAMRHIAESVRNVADCF